MSARAVVVLTLTYWGIMILGVTFYELTWGLVCGAILLALAAGLAVNR